MPDQDPLIWHKLVTAGHTTSGASSSRCFGRTRREVDAGPVGTPPLFQIHGRNLS